MDLDDRLAALAAGELDEDEARALRARVDGDVRLRRRLARFERLERLLTGWDVEPMTEEQVAALDERVTAALDELDDAPLTTDRAPVVGIDRARARRAGDEHVGAAPSPVAPRRDDGDGEVVDLGAARLRRGIPSWASGLVAAAAALALVTSVGVGLDGFSGGDDADSVATDDAGLAAEADAGDGEEEAVADEAADTAAADVGGDDAAGTTTARDADGAVVAALPRPQVASDLVLDESTLADLADMLPLEGYETALLSPDAAVDEDGEDAGQAPDDAAAVVLTSPCATEVIDALAPDGVVAFVGSGTYEGVEAVVVVVLRDGPAGVERTTAAYDAATCELLAEVVGGR